MDTLTAAIQRCQLSLKLDNETEGQGNCFPNSIVQQKTRSKGMVETEQSTSTVQWSTMDQTQSDKLQRTMKEL